MAFLQEAESRILGLLAVDPSKYAYLLDLLKGEARKIGEGLVDDTKVDAATADAVKHAKAWARQSRTLAAQ